MIKKPLTILTTAALALGLVASPYSLNFDITKQETSAAQQVKSKKNLAFYGSNSAVQTLDKVEKNNKDDGLTKIKKKIKDKQLKTTARKGDRKNIINDNINEFTDVAYDVKEVRDNPELQKRLQDILHSGKKVYLYGGLTLVEYRELLNLKEMSADVTDPASGKTVVALYGEEKEEKASKTKTDPNARVDDDIKEVIGYTLDPNDASKVYISDITVTTPTGETKPSEEQYMREVIEGVNATIDKEEGNIEQVEVSSIINENKASAGNVTRKSSQSTISASAYWGSYLLGRIYTDWTLFQDTDESEYTYDYFVVKDRSQIYSYNGARTNYVYVDHDIPASSDEVVDWGPVDDTSSPYSVSIGIPWNISTSFSMSSSPKVDAQGSTAYDYGRWVLTDYSIGDGEVFQPYTAWKSTGTLASMDIRKKATFINGNDIGSGLNQHIDVTYDYTTRQQ